MHVPTLNRAAIAAVACAIALTGCGSDSTETTDRSLSLTAWLTSGISGPELPMQVVQP